MPLSQEDKISKNEREESESLKLEKITARIIVVKVNNTAIIKGEGKNLLKKFSISFVICIFKMVSHHALHC